MRAIPLAISIAILSLQPVSSASAFTINTRLKILEDAIQLSPSQLKEYLKSHEAALIKHTKNLNRIENFDDSKYVWSKIVISHYTTLSHRLRKSPNDFNTYIHFVHLTDALCKFIEYNKWDTIYYHNFQCPDRIDFDGYQKVTDVSFHGNDPL